MPYTQAMGARRSIRRSRRTIHRNVMQMGSEELKEDSHAGYISIDGHT